MTVFLVFLGGGIGSVARYTINLLLNPAIGVWSTFVVNLIGSIVIGLLASISIREINALSPQMKFFLITGILGGFTTFSSFQLDLYSLFDQGHFIQALSYLICTVIVSFLGISISFQLLK